MSTVIITGSTRGIGYALADSFLARECRVAVSGRSQDSVDRAADALRERHPKDRFLGFPCDVREQGHLEALWQATLTRFGQVDIWINNAGFSGSQQMISESTPDETEEILDTNLLGTIFGSQVAVKGMTLQGHGSIYNMEGAGSDGRMHEGLILYGLSKYGVSYFTRGLIKETAGSPLIVGSLKPGMVITEFITRQFEDRPEEWERAKRIFNIIADRAETVAPWLADRILANNKHGAQISYLSRGKIALRFLTAPITRRDLFLEDEPIG